MSDPYDSINDGVSVAALQPLIFVLRERKLNPTALLENANLRLEQLTNLTHRIPLDQYHAIWHQAVGMTGDAALGIHVGLRSEPVAFGLVGYVLANARDCRTAFLLWNHYSRLILDAPLFELAIDGDVASISVARTTDASPDSIRPLTEFVMFSLLRVAVFLTNIDPSDQSELRGLEFRHSRPSDDVFAEYVVASQIPNISFSANANRISFAAAFLDRPIAYADPAMLSLMTRRSDEVLRTLAVEQDLVIRVKAAIRRRIGGSAPTLDIIAQDCRMSRAGLQRKLAGMSSGFQKILDEVRFQIAQEYLIDSSISLDELSFLLGYSESPAFHHAFKRWSGIPPAEYRALQQ